MKFIVLSFALLLPPQIFASDSKDFLANYFESIPKPERIWIDKDKKKQIISKFNPSQIKLSYRYWQKDGMTIWILDEIGKERNITTAVVIEYGLVKSVDVITYRESRGGAIQSKRFTTQYQQKSKTSHFEKEIDSISGATLSVNAVNKQVHLALYLDSLR